MCACSGGTPAPPPDAGPRDAGPRVVGLVIHPGNPTITSGATQQFTLSVTDDSGVERAPTAAEVVQWSTDSATTATIDASGLAHGVGLGTATITARLGAISATTTLRVSPDESGDLLSITPTDETFPIGEPLQFAAIGHYRDGQTAEITSSVRWTSDAPSVAAIDAGGLAVCQASGDVTITARWGAGVLSNPARLRCRALVLDSIAVRPVRITVRANYGSPVPMRVVGLYTDGTRRDLSALATWTSSVPAVAAVVTTGGVPRATFAAPATPGETLVRASYRMVVSAPAQIRVLPALTVARVDVTPATVRVRAGGDQQFHATAIFEDGSTADVTTLAVWSSAMPAEASIVPASGLVHGVAPGTTTVTATLATSAAGTPPVVGRAQVVVTAGIIIGLEVAPAAPSIAAGDTATLRLAATYSDGVRDDAEPLAVSWSSTMPSVAVVDARGEVRAIAPGTATIRAQLGTVIGTTVVTVNGAAPRTLSIIPLDPRLPVGRAVLLRALATWSDGSTSDVSPRVAWSTAAPTVVSIGADGEALALSTGPAVTISATLGALTSTIDITPADEIPVSLELNAPGPLALLPGASRGLGATAVYPSGLRFDVTHEPDLAFDSSPPAVATVDNAPSSRGRLSAVTPGTASVGATLHEPVVASPRVALAVSDSPVVAVEIAPSSTNVPVAFSLELLATLLLADGTRLDARDGPPLAWSTSDIAVATTSNIVETRGVLHAIRAGSVEVDAALEGPPRVTAASRATITAAALVSLAITPASVELRAGGPGTVVAVTGTFADGSIMDVTRDVTLRTDDPLRLRIRDHTVDALATAAPATGLHVIASRGGVTATSVVSVLAR